MPAVARGRISSHDNEHHHDSGRVPQVRRPGSRPGRTRLASRPRRPAKSLIRVHASTVSAADHRARSRDIPAGLGLLAAFGLGVFRPRNHILGMDVAGVVEAVGADVTTLRARRRGDRHDGRPVRRPRRVRLRAADGAITRAPSNMTFEQAVTLPVRRHHRPGLPEPGRDQARRHRAGQRRIRCRRNRDGAARQEPRRTRHRRHQRPEPGTGHLARRRPGHRLHHG